MSIFSRSNSKLDKRKNRIEAELSTLDDKIRSLSKRMERGEVAPTLSQPVLRTRSSALPPRDVAPYLPRQQRSSAGRSAGELQDGVSYPGAATYSDTLVDEGHELSRDGSGDTQDRELARVEQQYAGYFTGGKMKKGAVAPLRRERHLQRRKALFLILCLAMLLFALLFFRVLR